MAVIVTPANKITLEVDTHTIECQVTAYNLSWADPSAGDPTRTGCGDIVLIPADSTEVATLDLTVFDDRTPSTGFTVWTRQNHGESATFDLVVNPGEASALQYVGKVTVAAVPDKQDAFTKIETVDVSWSVTELTVVAEVPVP
jgi:hypothetical protein